MNKARKYEQTYTELIGLLSSSDNRITNLANASALLALRFKSFSWVGFYLAGEGELLLGPFQGKPACVKIAFGQGVCGTAAKSRQTIIVPDVHLFPGHIACDGKSASEIVVPIIKGTKVCAVLDIDSYQPANFDDDDRQHLEKIAALLSESAF